MDKEIADFIAACKVATVCCLDNGAPYCFNCFYSFMEKEGLIVYKSSHGTKHEELLKTNKAVAGTIIPEEIEVATIRGIQYEGILLDDDLQLSLKASSSYYLRFPFAMAIPGKLYVLSPSSIKYTDNTKGFGYKKQWQKEG